MPPPTISFQSVFQSSIGSTNTMCNVTILFQILGPHGWYDDVSDSYVNIDQVQVYAVNAANVGPGSLGDLVDTKDIDEADYQYTSVVNLQAGAVYKLALCPRSVTDGELDDKLGSIYWEQLCIYEAFTTQVNLPPVGRPRPPIITSLKFHPATVQNDGSITVTWEADATANYQSFVIAWSEGGHSRAQGERDYPYYPITTGSWTAPQVYPTEVYTFSVSGGVYKGIGGFNYYDWSPKAQITAPSNLTSLRNFLSSSGINPAGVHLRSLMSPLSSLRQFMKFY